MPNGHMSEPAIEAITGCMFSGKTDELARRLRILPYGSISFAVFYPEDHKRLTRCILTHFPNAKPIASSSELLDFARENPCVAVLAVDEGQFLDRDLPTVAETLAFEYKRRVIISGLNLDFMARPFGPMPEVVNRASDITLLHAVCTVCGRHNAVRSQRLSASTALNDSGKKESYEARCLNCFIRPTSV